MTEQQTILGFFDTIAEAQQAVQCLLARGFTHETVTLSMVIDPARTTASGETKPAGNSGRFLAALFGEKMDGRSAMASTNASINPRLGTQVTVKTQSADEARQVAELLDAAGAANIAVEANG